LFNQIKEQELFYSLNAIKFVLKMEKNILILLCIFLGIISFRLWYNSFTRKKHQRKRFKRGLKLEQKAAKFLTSRGFTIIGEQVEYQHTYLINGEENSSKISIDYLVEKNSKVFVVEVKSGKSAISIKNRSTRRQLLEYAVTIECDGLYLLDMENKELQLIEFKFPNSELKSKNNNGVLLALVSLIFVLLYLIYRLLY
jgi:Holliday junction resolvase-like predicted endonuclease